MNRRKFIKRYVKAGATGLFLPTIFVPKLLAADSYAPHRRKAFRPVAAAAGGAAFSDNFDRANADALGANWTEFTGDIDIVGNQARQMSTGFATDKAYWSAGSCNTVNQYGKVTLTDHNGAYFHGILFRHTPAGGHYMVFVDVLAGQILWTDQDEDSIGTAAVTIASGDTWGITLTGTGTNTVVRVWRNPTGLALSATDWNGDTTPDVTLTNDPGANAVDTGVRVGICGGSSGGGGADFNNWFAGDIP